MSNNNPPPRGGGRSNWKGRKFRPFDLSNVNAIPEKPVNGRFLIAKRSNGDLLCSNINKFVTNKFLKELLPSGFSLPSKLREGHLLFQAYDSEQAQKALGDHDIPGSSESHSEPIKITISLHEKMNVTRGVFVTSELKNESNEEILENIKKQNEGFKFTSIERLKCFRNGSESDAQRFILTVEGFSLPEDIFIAYMKFSVRLFHDNPLRCTLCQEYRHTKKWCTKKVEKCRTCSLDLPHENNKCGATRCVNCLNPHPSNHPDCPVRNKEVLICKIQAERRVSPREARTIAEKLFNDNHFVTKYSEVVGTGETSSSPRSYESPYFVPIEKYNQLSQAFDKISKTCEDMSSMLRELKTELSDLRKENVLLRTELKKSSDALSDEVFSDTDDNQMVVETLGKVSTAAQTNLTAKTADTMAHANSSKNEHRSRHRSRSRSRSRSPLKVKSKPKKITGKNLSCLNAEQLDLYQKLLEDNGPQAKIFLDPVTGRLTAQVADDQYTDNNS